MFYCPGQVVFPPSWLFSELLLLLALFFIWKEKHSARSLIFPRVSVALMRRFRFIPPDSRSPGRGRETEGAENELPRDALFSNIHSVASLLFRAVV